MDWHTPLVISALLFAAFLLWKLRPALGSGGRGGAVAAALRDAKQRIDAAKDDVTRAQALSDAGDACAQSLGRTTGAVGYYLRAMRADPTSAAIVERAAKALAGRPYALESLLWRRLGATTWTGDARPAAIAALRHLAALYAGPLRNRPRGRALHHALAALGEPDQGSGRPELGG